MVIRRGGPSIVAMRSIRSIVGAILLLAFAGLSSPAWACHEGDCPSETPPDVAFGVAVNAGVLLLDVRWAARGERPGRAWAGLELGVAALTGLDAFASGFDEGHDYQTAAQVGLAVAAVVAVHGVYVLVRGGDPGTRSVGIAPVVHDRGASLVLAGRF